MFNITQPPPQLDVPPDETLEPFGRLWVRQKKQGYRFSLDAVLLAGLTSVPAAARVMDLGTGCGIVSLILACRHPRISLVGVESQVSLADLAWRNVHFNGLAHRIRVCNLAMQEVAGHFPPASFDLVVSNPPYRPLGAGRLNPGTEKALARHELQGSLAMVAQAARYLLPSRGRLTVIYPAWRTVHLLSLLRSQRLEPKTICFIHSRPGVPACLVWLEARKDGREEVQILPPLVIYQDKKHYSAAMAAFFDF